jgi:hypothetical protein
MPAAATKQPKRKPAVKPPPNAIALPKFRGGSLGLLLNHDHEVILFAYSFR